VGWGGVTARGAIKQLIVADMRDRGNEYLIFQPATEYAKFYVTRRRTTTVLEMKKAYRPAQLDD